jgi:hypothetical protein
MQLMLVQTGEIIWSGKGALRNNNTRDELLSRYFPSIILIAPQAIPGLAARVALSARANDAGLAQHHDPLRLPPIFAVSIALLSVFRQISCLPLFFQTRLDGGGISGR